VEGDRGGWDEWVENGTDGTDATDGSMGHQRVRLSHIPIGPICPIFDPFTAPQRFKRPQLKTASYYETPRTGCFRGPPEPMSRSWPPVFDY
jgi:hypothetical protein